MAQLQMPLSIWLSASPEERDAYYLEAGFDPNTPVYDNGTDTTTVRFAQDVAPITPTAIAPMPVVTNGPAPAGEDMRDWELNLQTVAVEQTMTNGVSAGQTGSTSYLGLAGRALAIVLGGGGGRLTASIWNSLPSFMRTALTQAGIGVGAMVAFSGDIPFVTLPGQGDPTIAPIVPSVPVPVPSVIDIPTMNPLQPVSVVGTWVANGVTFYRLADGKLAVQNKKGRWKVWKPKKPIVLYADGASNLKTMLRADRALNKQAKKIAAMLNRRAPRRKSTPVSRGNPVVLGNNARIVDV